MPIRLKDKSEKQQAGNRESKMKRSIPHNQIILILSVAVLIVWLIFSTVSSVNSCKYDEKTMKFDDNDVAEILW